MSRLILELRTYCHNKALFFTNCMDFSSGIHLHKSVLSTGLAAVNSCLTEIASGASSRKDGEFFFPDLSHLTYLMNQSETLNTYSLGLSLSHSLHPPALESHYLGLLSLSSISDR